MIRILVGIFAAAFISTGTAQAGVLLEPYAGYNALLVDFTLGSAAGAAAGQGFKSDATGVGFGARLGFTLPMFFAAVDYSSATLKNSLKDVPVGLPVSATDTTNTNLGLTAGLNLAIVRPYFTYIFDSQSKSDSSTTFGTGYRFGLGFKIVPMVSVNLEYAMATYTKSKDTAGTETTIDDAGFFKSVKASGYALTVSAPFSF
ncbi:MAG: outer membrane beta-barrel protein [Bdellovibrionia bacterium]